MPNYRVFYLKEELSRRFRELPASSVRKQLKPKDYFQVAEIEAANEYAAWQALQAPVAGDRPFAVGDVLEPEDGRPRLCQFGGFEEAAWWSPEIRSDQPASGGDLQPGPEAARQMEESPKQ